MPLLKIEINVNLSQETKNNFLKQASNVLSAALGKSEKYVMCTLEDNRSMVFGGDALPTAYVELKSIELSENNTTKLSKTVCELINAQLEIPVERIYIEFTNAQRHMWGWNNRTF